jgi:hypothetical protein
MSLISNIIKYLNAKSIQHLNYITLTKNQERNCFVNSNLILSIF